MAALQTDGAAAAAAASPATRSGAAQPAADASQPVSRIEPGTFHPSSGPEAPMSALPYNTPAVGIERARALRKAWLTQTRPLPAARPEPDYDELEEAFEDEAPFDPPVHLPNLLLLLLDIWDDEGCTA